MSAAARVPLQVLLEARDALDACRTLRTYPAPTQEQLFALQRQAAHAQGGLQYWIKQAIPASEVRHEQRA